MIDLLHPRRHTRSIRADQPAAYRIEVRGSIGTAWAAGLEEAVIEQRADRSLIDIIVDQAALRGLLCRLWDLNFIVIAVNRMEVRCADEQEVPPMTTNIKTFSELTAEQQAQAGGKGGSLAKMYQAGFPVPDGFVILPTAFAGETLTPTAWGEMQGQLTQHHATAHDGTTALSPCALRR